MEGVAILQGGQRPVDVTGKPWAPVAPTPQGAECQRSWTQKGTELPDGTAVISRRQFLYAFLTAPMLRFPLPEPRSWVLMGLGTCGTRIVSAWAGSACSGSLRSMPVFGLVPQPLIRPAFSCSPVTIYTLPLLQCVPLEAPLSQKRAVALRLVETQADALFAQLGRSRELVLVCALGGVVGAALCRPWADRAAALGSKVTVLASGPFGFEGERAADAAHVLIAGLRERHTVILQDNKVLEQKLPLPVRLPDLLHASDQHLLATLTDLLAHCRTS